MKWWQVTLDQEDCKCIQNFGGGNLLVRNHMKNWRRDLRILLKYTLEKSVVRLSGSGLFPIVGFNVNDVEVSVLLTHVFEFLQ